MKIESFDCDFERERLSSPFGFKGGRLSELWQTAASLTDVAGRSAVGLGTQSPLWSDAKLFARHGENACNAMMLLSTAFAGSLAKELEWNDPLELLDGVFAESFERAKAVSGMEDLRKTFVLNSLVGLDNAAWLLYAKAKGASSFDAMIPERFKSVLGKRHSTLVSIPLVSYGVSEEGILRLLEDGCCLLKVKIGADPEGDGDPEKMLEWDKARLSSIHNLASRFESDRTESGRILYYLDANGRYDSLERVWKLLEHAKRIGALDRIALFEEPFPEDLRLDVSALPVVVAADESAHSEEDAAERLELGYRAMALKPIAKTLSVSLRVAKLAKERGAACFCADLTVNPILVDWNKNFAARLTPLPGMKTGALESNGPQNYKDWERMIACHPLANGTWVRASGGAFSLDDSFYETSGGIFLECRHYSELFKH